MVQTASSADDPAAARSDDAPAAGSSSAGPSTSSATGTETTTKPKPETTTTETTAPEPETTTTEATDSESDDSDEQPGRPGDPDDTPALDHAASSIEYVNQRRNEHRMHGLEEDPELTALAEGWAGQMAAESNLYHNPNLFEDRPSSYRMTGENVAYNSNAGNIDSAWWDSDGHRANILNTSYSHIGVAFVQDGSGLWWAVQVFAA